MKSRPMRNAWAMPRLGLHGVVDREAELPTVAEQAAEGRLIGGVVITSTSRIPASIRGGQGVVDLGLCRQAPAAC